MPELMPAVRKIRPRRGLEMTEIPRPEIGSHEVLVEVKATSICGTDRQIYEWTPWARHRCGSKIPFTQGHELCGEIVEVGSSVRERRTGQFVSAESHIVDYQGEYFRRGLAHVAPETRIIGVDRDGAFARYIALPWQNTRPNPSDMPLKVAVLKENFGNAIHVGYAVDVSGLDVLITGAGPVGLMTLLIVRALGARTILISDVSRYRLDFALRLGADEVINPKQDDLVEKVRDLSPRSGVDVLLEMSGAPSAVLGGLDLLRAGGHAVAFGLPEDPLTLELSDLIIFKGITLHGIVGRRLWDTWEKMESLLREGLVDLSPIVTHQYPLADFDKAFETMEAGQCGKVMMRP
ncbi:MAG TPA: L-threonine 3-dehydrogenase [Acidobacteriota bacterium]|nr:L-threonine 3-dehydrogenase [Acidobacteriota bacterium]